MNKFAAACITIFLCLALCYRASASVPPMISYQGRLMQPNGTPVPDGTYSLRFAIYDSGTGGEPLWSETNEAVVVKGGLYAVLLGSVNNLGANILDSQNRYIGIKVGSDSELNPRQRVASVATALRAGEADIAKTVVDGAVTTMKIADGAVTAAKITDSSITAAKTADSSVTTTKIADSAVTAAKIADGTITASKLSTSAIMLGYAETRTDFDTQSNTAVQVPGLSVTVSVPPGGRRLKITVWCRSIQNAIGGYALISLWDGPVGSGTMIGDTCAMASAHQEFPASVISVQSPTGATKTYNVGLRAVGGDAYLSAGAVPAFILVEAL